jgi:hypothetical protein
MIGGYVYPMELLAFHLRRVTTVLTEAFVA